MIKDEFKLRRRGSRLSVATGNNIYQFVILYLGSEKSLSDPNCKIMIKTDLWTTLGRVKKYFAQCVVNLNNHTITDAKGNNMEFDNIDGFFERLGEELGRE